MKKFLILLLLFSFCSTDNNTKATQTDETQNYFDKFTPISCEGNGVGCENLYLDNANVGWKDTENKYCDISTLSFTFQEEFQIDFIEVTNFQDDKFDKSAKPKSISVFGPLDEDMQYGGYIERATLEDTREKQFIYIPEDWPTVNELVIEFQNGHFTPTSVDYCGIQNIEFFGYSVQDD